MMSILLAQEGGEIGLPGIILIAAIVVVIAICIVYDRKKAKRFCGQMEQNFEQKRIDGNSETFITRDHELVIKVNTATASEYNIFPLECVAYVFTAKDKNTKMWMFGLYDQNQKGIQGTKILSTKKQPQIQKGYILSNEEALEAVELVKKYVSNVKHVGMYFKEKE